MFLILCFLVIGDWLQNGRSDLSQNWLHIVLVVRNMIEVIIFQCNPFVFLFLVSTGLLQGELAVGSELNRLVQSHNVIHFKCLDKLFFVHF